MTINQVLAAAHYHEYRSFLMAKFETHPRSSRVVVANSRRISIENAKAAATYYWAAIHMTNGWNYREAMSEARCQVAGEMAISD